MRRLDDEGVVSHTLEVYGDQALRIVDASIMPLFVDQHPTAAIYMIAEKASQMIKGQARREVDVSRFTAYGNHNQWRT